jgi:outer membrane protein TolC
LASAVTLLSGCGLWDGSHYDTIAVPPGRVTRIEPIDLRALAREKAQGEPDRPEEGEETETAAGPQPAEKVRLGIEECRAIALERNLSLRVQLLAPVMAQETVNEADAAFEPYFFSNFSYVDSDTPVSLRLDASKSETVFNDAGIRIPLRTGGEITVETLFSRTETNNEFSTLNPAYTGDLAATVRQPLLRGGGIRTATHGIRIARYGLWAEQARTRLQVITVLAAVDRAYWRLYAAREELLVREQEYEVALGQLESARRLVEAQQVAEIEILRAEEAAAERLEGIIIAENEALDRERELKLVLNRAGLEMETPTIIETATVPAPVHYELDRERVLAHALEHRMELLELELQIASDTSSLALERNGLLPLLSVEYTYNVNGLGRTASDAYDLMLENTFADHRVGLALQIPLGNQAAASRVRRALAQREQRLATKERRTQLIKQEVLKAVDQLEANWQRVLASRRSAVLARRTLEAEENRFREGLQTSIEVLNAQSRHANARSAEIRALVEYQIAQVDLAYATGSLLGAARVRWDLETNELSAQ